MQIRDYRSKISFNNYKKGRNGWTPGLITLHTAAGSYEGTCSWFCNPEAGVSSHYVIGLNGEVTQCVDLADSAYVNGTDINPSNEKYYYGLATNPIVKSRCTNANNYTVGIEVAGHYDRASEKCTMTEKQKQAVIELIVLIVKEVKEKWGNNIPLDRTRICGHYEVNPVTKPFCGVGFPYDSIIKSVIAKLK